MKNKTIIFVGALFIISGLIFGFTKKPVENQKYEYLKITQRNKSIHISSNLAYLERVVPSSDFMDAMELLKCIEEYQEGGWEFVSAYDGNAGTVYVHNVLMRKPK